MVWKIGKWLAIGLAVVVLLLAVGLAWFTRTPQFHSLLREQILSVLNDTLNAEVSLERISGSIWSTIRFHNLIIRQDGRETIIIPEGALTLSLSSQLASFLRASTIRITRVTLTQPVVHAVETPELGWNLARLTKPAETPAAAPEPGSLRVLLPDVRVENGTVTLQPANGQQWQLEMPTLATDVSVLPTGLRADLKRLDFALSGPQVPPLHGNINLLYDGAQGVATVAIHTVELQTAASHLVLSGTVENLAAPSVNLTADLKNLAAADVASFMETPRLLQDLSGTLEATGPLAALRVTATLSAPSGQVRTAITADLSQSPPTAQGTLTVDQFTVGQVIALPDVAGQVSGNVSFRGLSLPTLQATVEARVDDLVVQQRSVGNVSLTAGVEANRVRYTVAAENGAGSLSSTGQVSLDPPLGYDVAVTARNLDVAKVPGASTLPTNINLDATVKGTGTALAEAATEIQLTVLPSRLGTTNITGGEFVGALRDGQLRIDKGMLLADDTSLRVNGTVGGLQGTPNSALTYHVQTKNLTPWLALAGMQAAGAVDVSGSAKGTLTALQTEGKITLANVHVDTNAIGSGIVTYSLTGLGGPQPVGHVTAQAQDIIAGTQFRSLQADLSLNGSQPLQIQSNVTVEDVARRTYYLEARTQYATDRVEATISDLTLGLPSGTWKNVQDSHVVFAANRLSIDRLALQQAGQTVSVQGSAATDGPLDLTLQVKQLSLAELKPLLAEGPPVDGVLSADIRAQGTTANPDVTANVTTDALTVAGQTYAGLTVEGILRNKRLQLDVALRQDATHTLTVNGVAPVNLPGEADSSAPTVGDVDLRVRSDGLSLAFLELLSKDIQEVKGKATVNLAVHGPVTALAASGPIRLEDGHARVVPLGVKFEDINVTVQLSPNQVTLRQFDVRSGGGQISGQGTATLQGYSLTTANLTFTAERFRVIDTREYRAAVSGRLSYSGTLGQPQVQGDLRLVDATIRPDLALLQGNPAPPDPTIVVVNHAEAQEPETPKPAQPEGNHVESEFYQQLALNVGLTIPRDTWVHMREGSVELTGQVHARKEPEDELVVSGTIETVRGWYAIHGRKFRLERGVIVFSGGTPIDPSLEVVARYTLPDYKVDVTIGGTASQPTVSFSSDPVLEQADILSLLAFGKPANALTNDQKNTLQSQAVGAAAGFVAEELRSSLSESLGVDNLEFDLGEGASNAAVGVGKYIAPGVYVSTSRQLGQKSEGQEVSVEYQIAKNWQLKASGTAEGNSGVDILWKKRY